MNTVLSTGLTSSMTIDSFISEDDLRRLVDVNRTTVDCRSKYIWNCWWRRILLYCLFSLFSSLLVIDSISVECFLSSFVSSKSRFLHLFDRHIGMQFFVCSWLLLVDWELFHSDLFGKLPAWLDSLDEFEWFIRSWSNIVVGTLSNRIDRDEK